MREKSLKILSDQHLYVVYVVTRTETISPPLWCVFLTKCREEKKNVFWKVSNNHEVDVGTQQTQHDGMNNVVKLELQLNKGNLRSDIVIDTFISPSFYDYRLLALRVKDRRCKRDFLSL